MEMENGMFSLDDDDGPCLRHDHMTAFKKMEEIVQLMQGATDGISMESNNVSGNVFTGSNLVSWLSSRVTDKDVTEACHLSRQLKRFNYIYPVVEAEGRLTAVDGTVTALLTTADNSLYRFQAPYYWPSINTNPDDVEYAIYLVKKCSNKFRKEAITDYEQSTMDKLKQLHCDSWDFIESQSQEQLRLMCEYSEAERRVIAGQEKIFWKMRKPPPGEIDVMETMHWKGNQLMTRKPTKEELAKKRSFLRNRMNLQRLKISKVIDSMTQRSQAYMEHDPLLNQPEPSNPWITDDLSFWTSIDSPEQQEVVTERRLRKWGMSMRDLLSDVRGLSELRNFLQSEFSSENIEFLLAVWQLKARPSSQLADAASDIYKKFLQPGSEKEINIDSKTMSLTLSREKQPGRYMFEEAEEHIYSLLERDCYPRFLRSDQYKCLVVLAQSRASLKKKKFSFGFKKRVIGRNQKTTESEQKKLTADASREDPASSVSSSSSTAVAAAPGDSSFSGDSSDNCSRASDSQEWLNGRSQMSYSTGDLKTTMDSRNDPSGAGKTDSRFIGFSPLRLKKKLKKMVRSVSPLPQQSNLAVPRHHHHHQHHHKFDEECTMGGQQGQAASSAKNSSTDLRPKTKENIRTVVSVPGNLCNAAALKQP